MKFIEEKRPHIRIDEADLYIEQLIESYNLGSRYKGLLPPQQNLWVIGGVGSFPSA